MMNKGLPIVGIICEGAGVDSAWDQEKLKPRTRKCCRFQRVECTL
jgi:hypothetical protein